MQRYFGQIDNNTIILNDEDKHHLINVIRIKKHEQIEVVSNDFVYLCEIENLNPIKIKIISSKKIDTELDINIKLFFCLAKGDKIDLVIQKCVELGVNEITLVHSNRSIINYSNKDINKKLDRFNKIAKQASEQSHRGIIPKINGIVSLNKINKDMLCDINYVAYEKLANDSKNTFVLKENVCSISILIGPEGGLEQEEINYLESIGFKSISLGKRILRCETAAIYSLSVLSNMIEK